MHSSKGLLTLQSNSYFRANYDNKYLSKFKNFWESNITDFGTYHSGLNLYYNSSGKRDWSNANNYCASIGWRLPYNTETTATQCLAQPTCPLGASGGIPSNGYTWMSNNTGGIASTYSGSGQIWYYKTQSAYTRCVR